MNYQLELVAKMLTKHTSQSDFLPYYYTIINLCLCLLYRYKQASCWGEKGGQTGWRFVTEATLIESSCRSDDINVSRDVTFAQHLKRLSRALGLSCLIVCWISYDKQTGLVVVGGKRGSGGWECTRLLGPDPPPDPDAFANYHFVYFREDRRVSLESRSGYCWFWLIWGKLFHPPSDRHWADAAGLRTIKCVRCSSSATRQNTTGQSRYLDHHQSSASQLCASCGIWTWL